MSAPTHMTHIGLLQAICNSKSIKKMLIKQYVVSKKIIIPEMPQRYRKDYLMACTLWW